MIFISRLSNTQKHKQSTGICVYTCILVYNVNNLIYGNDKIGLCKYSPQSCFQAKGSCSAGIKLPPSLKL